MKIEQGQLLALVRLAIHPEEEIPEVLLADAIQWEKIYEEAKKQSLIGIAFVGYKRWVASEKTNKKASPIDDVLSAKWYGLTEKIRQRNLLLNLRSSQIVRNFAKDGFRTTIMKGQGNALLYGPELSLMRSPGDIDVWVEGGFEKVYGYVNKVTPTKTVNEQEIDFNIFDDVKVEVHYRPFIMRHPFRMQRLQAFTQSLTDECYNHRVKIPTITIEGDQQRDEVVFTTVHFNLVQQMAHIHRHLFTEGVGLRQILDYYFQLVHAEKLLSYEEKDKVVEVVKSVNLERLAKALMWILISYFGLPKDYLLWEPNKEDGEFFLEEIMRTGNFGKMDNRHPNGYKTGGLQSFIYTQKRNLKMSRFDRMDWFWGSLWRIYHFVWRRMHGFKH